MERLFLLDLLVIQTPMSQSVLSNWLRFDNLSRMLNHCPYLAPIPFPSQTLSHDLCCDHSHFLHIILLHTLRYNLQFLLLSLSLHLLASSLHPSEHLIEPIFRIERESIIEGVMERITNIYTVKPTE